MDDASLFRPVDPLLPLNQIAGAVQRAVGEARA
jgi:hypothetical protein